MQNISSDHSSVSDVSIPAFYLKIHALFLKDVPLMWHKVNQWGLQECACVRVCVRVYTPLYIDALWRHNDGCAARQSHIQSCFGLRYICLFFGTVFPSLLLDALLRSDTWWLCFDRSWHRKRNQSGCLWMHQVSVTKISYIWLVFDSFSIFFFHIFLRNGRLNNVNSANQLI